MRRNRLLMLLVCAAVVAVAVPASASKIFISNETSPGSVVVEQTASIDITGGGAGTFGIWVIPDALETLLGVDLNVRVVDTGNAIDLTGATILNPTAGATKRWYDDTAGSGIVGIGTPVVGADLITNLIGVTVKSGGLLTAPPAGVGLVDGNTGGESTSTSYQADINAFLFATVNYTAIDDGSTANVFLQIGASGVADDTTPGNSLVMVEFGPADALLDSSIIAQREIDSAIADAETTAGPPCALGDFNCDTNLDLADINPLSNDIRDGTGDLLYDVTGDNAVTIADLTEWVQVIRGTWFGNTNLDSAVDITDLAVLGGNFGDPGMFTWQDGDFNADGTVDITDLAVLGGNFGNTDPFVPATASASGVPEPASFVLLALAGVALFGRRRRC